MEINGLTRRQIAELGELLGKNGYSASDFRLERGRVAIRGDSSYPALRHASGAYFAFGRHFRAYAYSDHLTDEGFRVGFSPGTDSPSEERGPLDWTGVSSAFDVWLKVIRDELAAPAFAEAATLACSMHGLSDDAADNTPFNAKEQNEVLGRLNAIEAELARQALDVDAVRRTMADLRDELTRMQRGRWKSLALGAIFKLTLDRAIETEAAKRALDEIGTVVAEFARRLNS